MTAGALILAHNLTHKSQIHVSVVISLILVLSSAQSLSFFYVYVCINLLSGKKKRKEEDVSLAVVKFEVASELGKRQQTCVDLQFYT